MTSILTVDDSASMRMAIRIALDGAGHNVVEAADGVEGLSKAREAKFVNGVLDAVARDVRG